MRLERSKNAFRNVGFGLLEKIVTIILPFAVRTILIKTLGAEYLGLNSLFTSILTVLNMTELGFSSAIVFSMYKPIAEDDVETIDALLNFYKTIYRVIGILIFIVGLILIPFLPNLINGSYPTDINLISVYLIYLINTSISYILFAYLGALITAHQRDDAISRVNIIISIIMYLSQIGILITVRNYYVYIITMPLFTIVNNIRTALVAKKLFPQYRPIGKLNKSIKKDIKEKINGLMIQKICVVSRNAFDSIFISMFLGLTETAMYNNYYYILNAITAIMTVFTASITAGAGNSVAMESKEKNFEDFKKLDFLYMWIGGWFSCCLLGLFQPFMKLWVGDSLMLPIGCVVLMCVYFYALKTGDVRSIYSTANGLWWKNRYRSIAEAVSNILLNYFLGRYWGVYGIILATVLTIIFINFMYGGQLIFKFYFTEQSKLEYFGAHALYFGTTIVVAAITFLLCGLFPDGIVWFGIKVAICAVVPNLLYLFVYRKTTIYKLAMPWIVQRMPKKIGKLIKI